MFKKKAIPSVIDKGSKPTVRFMHWIRIYLCHLILKRHLVKRDLKKGKDEGSFSSVEKVSK